MLRCFYKEEKVKSTNTGYIQYQDIILAIAININFLKKKNFIKLQFKKSKSQIETKVLQLAVEKLIKKEKIPYKTEMKERREIKLEQKDREKRQTQLQVSTINGKGYETKRVSGPSRSMTVSFRATGWNNRLVKH